MAKKKEENNESLELVKVNQLNSISEQVKGKYLEYKTSAETAVLHLSKITEIETREEYDKAIQLLVKVKATYTKVKEGRLEWSKKLDEVKDFLMIPEKLVSLEKADSGNEAHRVKKLADNWLNEENKRLEAERQAALRKQYLQEEKARIESVVKTAIVENLNIKIGEIDTNLGKFFQGITLENFAEKEKTVKVSPKLKEDFYDRLFLVSYDQTRISADEFNEYIKELKSTNTYEEVNKIYVKAAKPIIDSWVKKLPQKKKDLEALAKAAQEDEEKAKALKAKQDAQEAAEAKIREEQRNATLEAQKQSIEVQKNINVTNAMFETQIAAQAQETMKGGRKNIKAVLDCKDEDIIVVISKMLFAIMTSEKYTGFIKKDKKTGEALIGDDGFPVYENWLADILADHAKLNEKPVEGVRFVETQKATIRK